MSSLPGCMSGSSITSNQVTLFGKAMKVSLWATGDFLVCAVIVSELFLVLSCFWGRFCLEWCGEHKIKRETRDHLIIVEIFIVSWVQLSALLHWLALCVCEWLPLCQKWTDTGDSSRKAWFGGTDQLQTLFKMLSSKAFSRTLSQQLHYVFFSLNLFGTKLINIFQGVFLPLLHNVILILLYAPSYHSLR